MAGLGDADVLAWGQRLVAARHQDDWMGHYIVARSPLPLADVLARRTIRRGEEDSLTALVQGYKDSTNPKLWDRLADVVAMRARPPKVDAWLKQVFEGTGTGRRFARSGLAANGHRSCGNRGQPAKVNRQPSIERFSRVALRLSA